MYPIVHSLLGIFAAGMATTIGAAVAFLFPNKVPRRVENTMLGAAAGIMLGAAVFSLIVPAIAVGGIWRASGGMIMGALAVHLADRFIPHEHFYFGKEGPDSHLKGIWLFVIAITLHNFPEGWATGVAYGLAYDVNHLDQGDVVAIAIGIQNIPEGLAVALALMRAGYSNKAAFFWAAMTGCVEPPSGFIGFGLTQAMQSIMPWGLAFSGGAMLFVISDEIIPETHSQGKERLATAGLIAGFVVMMILEKLL